MTENLVVGIDIGTTAVKALLLTAAGRQLDRVVEPYPTARSAAGIVEQDPEDWYRLVLAALSRFERNFDLGGLKAIGICSQVNTHVFVADDSMPLAPAIVWQDGRCAEVAEELDAQVEMAMRIEWWGGPLPIGASHALSRMEWMRRVHPDVWNKTRWVMAPKDHCILRLTGAAAADPIASVGLVGSDLRYIAPLLDLVPGSAKRLPPLYPFTHEAGPILPGLPCAGTPVVVGTMDAWGGMFGVGVEELGSAMYLSGTSEVVGIISPERVPTPGVIAFPTYDGITMHAAPTQSGGASMAWLGGLLGREVGELCQLGGALDATEKVPLFLPHLEGERAPIWDSTARGVFIGLDTSTGPAQLARSVMEGVAYSARWLLEALEHSAHRRVDVIKCGGGGFRSDAWNQIRANVLGRTLQRVANADAAALGAAAIAAAGTGMSKSIAAAAASMAHIDREYIPDRNWASHYDLGFGLYKELYAATSSISRRYV